jgi:intracellular sulfur oxidation DsrE/DsrF family protein
MHQEQIHVAAHHQGNLLLHLTSNDPAKMEAALDYAEQLLAEKRHKNSAFQLEVVANDGGVELLRRDTSPYPQRIEKLLTEYNNVSFLACANALRKLRARGVKVELLPGTRSDNTAIGEIVKRIEGGWNYLKV